MRQVTVLAGLFVFWMTMMVLLWRAEFGGGSLTGRPVSPEIVWKKLLTSPDPSAMTVFSSGEKLGRCLIIATVGEGKLEALEAEETEEGPIGRIRELTGYTLKLQGSLQLPESKQLLRFDATLEMTPAREWTTLSASMHTRPVSLELEAIRQRQSVRVKFDDGQTERQQLLSFDSLKDPAAVVRELTGLQLPLVMNGALPLPEVRSTQAASKVLTWTAHTDVVEIRGARARVYRLETRMMDLYPVSILVSRAGEVMRVELPFEIEILNDVLLSR